MLPYAAFSIRKNPVLTGTEALRRDVGPTAMALRIVTLGLGIFFLAMSYNKLAWFGEPSQLTQRLERWLPDAAPYARVYLQALAIPGAELFARIVPIAELLTALSMLTGLYMRIAAAAALFMILNFHTATSSFSSADFLGDATGPPMFAALIAVIVAGRGLPLSFSWRGGRAH